MTKDVFADDPCSRLRASARIGTEAYGDRLATFASREERELALEEGWAVLRDVVDPDRVRAATNPRILSYGAWNPLVMFLGLSPGVQSTSVPRQHEHVIGYPAFYRRWKGARGNPWFPTFIQELAADAFWHRYEFDSRLRDLAELDLSAFHDAINSCALVLNFSPLPTPAGDIAPIEWSDVHDDLVLHLAAFQPRVVVAVKPAVTRELRRITGDFELKIPEGDEPEAQMLRLGSGEVPLVSMPIHPNALGKGFRRLAASRPRVVERIAEFLT